MSILDALKLAKQFLELLAPVVDNKLVDKMLSLISALINSPELVEWFEQIVRTRLVEEVTVRCAEIANEFGTLQTEADVKKRVATSSSEVISTMPVHQLLELSRAAGINWRQLFETVLPILLRIVNEVFKQQEG